MTSATAPASRHGPGAARREMAHALSATSTVASDVHRDATTTGAGETHQRDRVARKAPAGAAVAISSTQPDAPSGRPQHPPAAQRERDHQAASATTPANTGSRCVTVVVSSVR